MWSLIMVWDHFYQKPFDITTVIQT
jgi:hypothetical protein